LFDGGYAGLTYPAAYGGQGLTAEFQEVFNEEAVGYELPTLCNVSLGILGPTILDFGTEEQKRRHLPAILRGDELWVQLLSERPEDRISPGVSREPAATGTSGS
jgi:alkylation response protein AidB-like acyl-CoA dehydrogenase